MSITPKSRPQQSFKKTLEILKAHGVDTSVPCILGVRAYYRDSMGKPGENDRKLNDDAIFLCLVDHQLSFNANTDPNGFRKGHGTSEATKGMASLAPGVWPFFRGKHKGKYPALKQYGKFTLFRDADNTVDPSKIFMHHGVRTYIDHTDTSGINIHHGSETSTSSLGCQTLPPSQWDEFILNVYAHMDKFKMEQIKYCLIENNGEKA